MCTIATSLYMKPGKYKLIGSYLPAFHNTTQNIKYLFLAVHTRISCNGTMPSLLKRSSLLLLFTIFELSTQAQTAEKYTGRTLLQLSSGFNTVLRDARVDLDSSLFITSKRYKQSRVSTIAEGIDDAYTLKNCGWMDTGNIDSAKRQLAKMTGANHARLFLLIGAYYAFHPGFHQYDSDRGIAYLLQAKKETDALKLTKWSAQCACLLGKCYFKENNITEGKRWFSTVTNDARLITDKQIQAKCWNYEGMYCPFVAQTTLFRIDCLNKALKLYKALNDSGNQANTLMDISYLSFAGGKMNEAKDAATQSLALQKSTQFPYTQYSYDLLAFYALLASDSPKELEMAFAALNSAEKTNDSLEMAHFYKRISNGFIRLNNETEYNRWEKRAMEAYEKHGGDSEFWDLLTSFSNQYATPEDGKKVLNLIKKTWKNYPPANPVEKQTAYIALGSCYQRARNYKEAHSYYLLAEKLEQQNQVLKGGMINHYLTFKLCASYYFMKNYAMSRKYAKMLIYRPVNDIPAGKDDFLRYYFQMHQLDSVAHNYKSSIYYLHKYANLLDTISSKNESRQIIDINIKYETLQKEKKLQELKTQNILERQKDALTKKITYAGFGLLLFVIVMIYSRYYFNKKSNAQLKKQKEEIDDQNSSLQSMNKKQQSLLTEKELLLKEIHHRVKNNLQTSMSLLNMQSAYVDNEVALETIRISQRRMHAMSLIHQKLYQSEKLTSINMAIYIDELTIYLRESFIGPANISFELRIPPLELDIAQALPLGLIINEAITNSIKYAFPDRRKGMIYIFLEHTTNEYYLLTIRDNGTGLPDSFDSDSTNSLGMNLMRGLSEQLQGEFIIQNNHGTQITVTIKKTEPADNNDLHK